MAIIKQYHKDTDTTYVYESISYWDASKGQSRSKRRLIGKVDPETGEIIPTGKRGRTKKAQADQPEVTSPSDPAARSDESGREKILQLELTISQLRTRVAELEDENREYRQALEKVSSLSARINAACQPLQQK